MTTDGGTAGPAGPEQAASPVRPGPAELGFADPVSAAASLSRDVAAATERLRLTATGLLELQVSEPSRLPRWTRGHLLTHVARNADSLRNLLYSARTGIPTPQYPDEEFREQSIATGAGRPVTELVADLDESAAALAAEAAGLSPASWAAAVEPMRGGPHPAWFTMWRRLTEVEVHHVDLGAGYEPADWPAPFAAAGLRLVAGNFSRPGVPAAVLISQESGDEVRIGPPDTAPEVRISGPASPTLAWLMGRSDGTGLTAQPAGPLPVLPSW
jgi:maleylpyruvate isomerase